MMVVISLFLKILSSLAFSTFNTFPLRGRMAWNFLSLPLLQLPPALSPSTMKISALAGSRSWQSASFPGRLPDSRALFLLVSSRAFLAASLAFAAVMHLPMMILAVGGCSSK